MYYYWNLVSGQEWKLAPDPLDSAREFIRSRGASIEHQVALVEMGPVAGARAMAFEVTDFVRAWAGHTEELAMDSTCTFAGRVSHHKDLLT